MTDKHPFSIECVQRDRLLNWSYLTDLVYELEFINFKCATVTKNGKGSYLNLVVYVCEDIEGINLFKGEILAISIPYRTFMTSLMEVPLIQRKNVMLNVLGDDNVYIKFTKKGRKRMVIHCLERRVADKLMLSEAKDLQQRNKIFFDGYTEE